MSATLSPTDGAGPEPGPGSRRADLPSGDKAPPDGSSTARPEPVGKHDPTPSLRYAESPVHGTGVFAGRPFAVDEVIETCPVLIIPGDQWSHLLETPLAAYVYEWEDDSALALGLGSLYNHRAAANARYEMDYDTEEITIFAARPITVGEEIFINYNGEPDDATPIWFELDNGSEPDGDEAEAPE